MVQSLTLTKAYQLKLLPSLVYSYSLQCSYFPTKKQNWWSHTKKHTICLWTRSEIRFRFTWEPYSLRPVQKWLVLGQWPTRSQAGLSLFLGRSHVNKKRNVWRPIQTHTGLSSSWSHVITPKISYNWLYHNDLCIKELHVKRTIGQCNGELFFRLLFL